MQEELDYVIAPKAKAISGEGLSGLIDGIFVGTKTHFYYVPQKVEEHGMREIKTQTMFYEGMPIQEFIEKKVAEPNLKLKDFEDFMQGEMKREMPTLRIVSIADDIVKFKATASFFGSSILTNDSDRKVGWKLFASGFGKAKKKIRQFYNDNPKLANK